MTETIITVNETVSITKLTASDGMVLTNDSAYGKEIYLGVNDSPNNWHEITDAEYAEILADQEIDNPNRATEEDYQAALSEFGVKI